MKRILAAAALIVAALGFGSAATTTHQPTAGHRQFSASVATLGGGSGATGTGTAAPSDLGWGGGTPSLPA